MVDFQVFLIILKIVSSLVWWLLKTKQINVNQQFQIEIIYDYLW